MAITLQHSVHINAPAARIWAILTDLNTYPEWNPFIRSISGNLLPGARLRVQIAPPGGHPMGFRPVLTEIQENQNLEWLGQLGIKGLFDGRHRFQLTGHADGSTTFTQSEVFNGLLLPLLRKQLRKTLRGFEQMNTALKTRSEQDKD